MADGQRGQLDQNGRPLGRRALETRRKLLEGTEALLRRRSVREVHVVEIARRIGTSPATFYQYFKDVEEAALALAEEAAEEMPAVAALIAGPWRGRAGLATARSIVDAFIQHWDRHQAVLRLRNLGSDEGDPRFREVRSRAMTPILDALAQRIRDFQADGKVPDSVNAYAAAAAMGAILERLAAYRSELEHVGVSRQDLVQTSARILMQTVSGSRVR